MGTFIFWIHYIISGILLYHILRCIYIKKITNDNGFSKQYTKTDEDKRLKHSLWIVLIFILVLFIPILNILVFSIYLTYRVRSALGEDANPYYCKSIFTKKY